MAAVQGQSVYIDKDLSVSLNTNSVNNSAQSSPTALETALADPTNGIVARVVSLQGTYCKIKFLRNGKPFGLYKSRNHDLSKATDALEYFKNANLGTSATASLAITGTQSGAAASTSQYTATLTRADSSTADVSASALWATSDATKATVSSSGLVTRVATGTATITATYGGQTNTRSVTVT